MAFPVVSVETFFSPESIVNIVSQQGWGDVYKHPKLSQKPIKRTVSRLLLLHPELIGRAERTCMVDGLPWSTYNFESHQFEFEGRQGNRTRIPFPQPGKARNLFEDILRTYMSHDVNTKKQAA